MKTEVYSWRVSAEKKAELEAQARRDGTSVALLLDQITSSWLTDRRNGMTEDEKTEQAAIRKRAESAIGSISGDDPTRSSRVSERVSDVLKKRYGR